MKITSKMKRRKMMLMVEVKRMMKMRDYCVFVAFLPESLICDGETIERAWA